MGGISFSQETTCWRTNEGQEGTLPALTKWEYVFEVRRKGKKKNTRKTYNETSLKSLGGNKGFEWVDKTWSS